MDRDRPRHSSLGRPVFPPRLPGRLLLCCIALLLGACASGGGVGKAVNRTLESVGLREAEPQTLSVPLRIHAAQNLNTGNDNQPSAVVVKLYRLKSAQKFEQAPFDVFLDEAREQALLGDDLLAVDEIVLSPGVRYEELEQFSPEAGTLGIVALFRAPAEGRWRLSFDARSRNTVREGITIGVHGCALTTSSEALTSRIAGDPASLASIRCAQPHRRR